VRVNGRKVCVLVCGVCVPVYVCVCLCEESVWCECVGLNVVGTCRRIECQCVSACEWSVMCW